MQLVGFVVVFESFHVLTINLHVLDCGTLQYFQRIQVHT